jgi:hypothetical protein
MGTNASPRSWAPRAALGLGLGTTMVLALLVPASGSSHREAPLITEDPAADNTDVYAFVSPVDPDSTTLISNFTGFQEPGGGPNYFKFGDDVLYEIHVDNDGDAVEDITYEFRFSTTTVDPDNYLYATGPIESIESAAWNRPQTYTVTKVEDGRRSVVGSDLLSPPNNVGPRSTPDYEALADEAVHSLSGGGKVFAGQRDEGFYVDIAAIFDLGTLRPFQAGHAVAGETAESNQNAAGIDTFAGYNVNSIALEVPTSELTTGGEDVIGVWSTASRRKVRVFAQNSSANPVHRGRWVQVSRLGQPLVNEVVVPLRFKDVFNTLSPSQDLDVFPTLDAPNAGSDNGDIPLVTDPILGEQIAALYGIDVPCTGPDPDCQRDDLVEVFLTGLEGVNQPANVRPAEVLRLNTAVPDSGFPNGRLVGDDVVDTALQVVAGALRDDAPPEAAALTDGVDGNDVPYLGGFPYLGTPHQGYELDNPARVTP